MRTETDKLCDAVDEFARAMKAKLLAKADAGWHGWRQKRYIEGGRNKAQLWDHLMRALVRNEPQEIDIANLLMFRWHYRRRQGRKG